ncbi:MAG: Bro-N domain-containing protein [Candidatus Desantisbacteria bacterium]
METTQIAAWFKTVHHKVTDSTENYNPLTPFIKGELGKYTTPICYPVLNHAQIALFKGRKIRKTIHNNEWWFSVVDVVQVLTDQSHDLMARKYWNKLSQRLRDEGSEPVTNCHRLKLLAPDGKMRETDCANTEGIFRIIQSIPSPKAEPFKRWLAKVGYERMQEIENPELATKRTRMLYKLKGYPDDWIEKRMRGIAIREELTDEWQNRGAKEQRDYEILTAEISKATFGVTPSEYKNLKGLKRENLRDHMDDFELIFTMLGERATTEIHRTEDSQGVPKLKSDAKAGGDIAGNARKQLEKRLGKSVVSKDNFLNQPKRLPEE